MDPRSSAEKAVGVIGMGYDLTTDILLSACKVGPNGSRLIQLDETVTKDLVVPGGVVVPDVPASLVCGKGERTRFCSDALSFQQMSELFNQELSLSGKIPSGLFNAMFDFKSCWQRDAADTRVLAFDGWFINLYSIELAKCQITLSEQVKQEILPSWNPSALAEFILKYGTHIVVGVKMGGKDVIHMKQLQNSNMELVTLQQLLKQLADRKFIEDTDESPSLNPNLSIGLPKEEQSVLWNLKSSFANGSRTSIISYSKNEDIICNHIRCGGIDKGQSHRQWLSTVLQSPDVIAMSFVPISSLLSHVPGSGFLGHAVNLYLRYKPPIEDLHDFLEFQLPRQWAPIFGDLPLALAHMKKQASPHLQFTFLGPKLFVNTIMTESRNQPVTGIRLYLEGRNCNHLAIHLQHLTKFSPDLQITENRSYEPVDQQEVQRRYFEPVKWTIFSHVCTVPIEYHGAMMENSAFIVTRACFEVKKINMRKVLFLRLGFSVVASARIRRSEWDESPMTFEYSGLISTTFAGKGKNQPEKPVDINSAVYPEGPPVPVIASRMKQFVDTKENVRGPGDPPGNWVVTGAKLCVEGGKIGVRAKYSVLKLCHSSL